MCAQCHNERRQFEPLFLFPNKRLISLTYIIDKGLNVNKIPKIDKKCTSNGKDKVLILCDLEFH